MRTIRLIAITTTITAFIGCGGGETDQAPPGTKPESMVKDEAPAKDIGVGPIKELKLPETIDQALADSGKAVFEAKCTACHKIGKRFVGPDLTGVINKQEPEWIMNMILNPEVMVKENETARNLLMEYSAPMANQNLTEEEARSVLEYFRTL